MHLKSMILAGAAAIATLAAAAPVAAEVVEQEDTYFVTRDTRVVSTDPYETWAALIAPNTWWNDNHTWSGDASNMYLSAQAGGCFCELLPQLEDAPEGIRRGSARHMEVVQASPPMVLRLRGGLGPLQSEPADGVLTVTLKPVDGGTRILWEYVVGGAMRYEGPVIAKAVDGVMSQQLAGLARLLGEIEGAEEDEAEAEDSDTEEAEAATADEGAPEEDTSSDESDEQNADDDASDESDEEPEAPRDATMGEPETARIEPKRVLTVEEALDQMAGRDEE